MSAPADSIVMVIGLAPGSITSIGLPLGNMRLALGRSVLAPDLIDLLVGRGSSDPARIAVAGVSMGACMVYAAVADEPRISVAVAMLGSPERPLSDAGRRPGERFFPTALLSITAGQDAVVPPDAARALHQRLESCYRARPERLSYCEIPGASHFLQPEEWDGAVARASAWLLSFLS